MAIEDRPVFTAEEMKWIIAELQDKDPMPEEIEITLAPERKERQPTRQPPVYWQNQLVVDAMTDEEKELKSLTRRNLKRLSNWSDWDKAFDKQMDEHHEAGVFGKPIPISSLPSEEQKRILQLHWTTLDERC